jgi:hypothetical protein
VFGRGRRRRAIFAAVADKMDLEVAESREWQRLADSEGEEAADERYPRKSVVDVVEELMPLAGNDVGPLMEALHDWYKDRTARHRDDDDRKADVSGMFLAVALNGIGNLFGFVPDEAPAYDEKLARMGRDRGWRT